MIALLVLVRRPDVMGGFCHRARYAGAWPWPRPVVVLGLNVICCCKLSGIRQTLSAVTERCQCPWPIAPNSYTPRTLPAEPTQAIRFGKARTAQSGALLEDYVELISDLLANGGEARPTDIARRLGVSHATAIKTIGRLKREGLAVAKPYRGVFLTEAGEHSGRPGARPPSAWWSICCWRSACRPRRRSRMPRGSSTTCPTRRWRRSRGSWHAGRLGIRNRRSESLLQRR